MIHAANIKVNGLKNPGSLTPGKVTFGWTVEGAKAQTAFQIIIRRQGGRDLSVLVHDSGKTESIAFSCEPAWTAEPGAQYVFEIRLWDETGERGERASGHFGTVIAKEDWTAKWIDPEEERPWLEQIPVEGQEHNPNPAARIRKEEHRKGASYLRSSFSFDGETESPLRFYATAHGIYDVWLNGTHLDGWLLAPSTSQYNSRLMVQGYDVTALVKRGRNTVLVSLGDGWYRGSVGNNMDINTFGDDLAFLGELRCGDRVLLATDETWEASQNGPLAENDMMRGEVYDARREENLTSEETATAVKGGHASLVHGWHPVKLQDYGYENLMGSDCQQIREHTFFQAAILHTPAGETVLDFGQNFAGYVRLCLDENTLNGICPEGGEKIVLTHGETLDEKGNFTTANFQNPAKPECFQRVEYICKKGPNHYHPTKCYFGFRYVKIETALPVTQEAFMGAAIYSDMEETAKFTCGNPDVNRLFQNTMWSMKSNFVGVPTDCPTREKSGFTGDAQVFCGTALYLMDSYPVFRQWLKELAKASLPDGGLRQVAPDNREPGYFEKSAGWCDAMEIIPWRLWKQCNTLETAREGYDAMKDWLTFCIDRGKQTRPENRQRVEEPLLPYFVDMGFHWGEWLEPGSDTRIETMEHMMHGEPEVATAYLSYGCRLMSEMAYALGKEEDGAYFSHVSEMAKKAYRQAFLPEGRVESERQCLYVRPLALGLLEEGEREAVAKALAEQVRNQGNRLNTGFLSTGELCRVLTDYGQAETAYDLLLQTECPGWLYPVRKGATTIWERWEGISPEGKATDSLNHYSCGAVAGWLMDRVCGINVEFGNIRIQPYPDRRLGYARGEYLSVMGKIACAWTYEGDRLRVEITIPWGCTAEVILPDGTREEKPCGCWKYDIRA